MELKGSQTEKNISKALAGESIARNKYSFYAMKAKEEGNKEIEELFEKMASNEMVHAKMWFQLLHNGLGNSEKNLIEAAGGEFAEWSNMYPSFAKTAREEGLTEVAYLFDRVASIEKDHERQFMRAYADFKAGIQSAEQTAGATGEIPGYRCMFCGATYEGRPDVCDFCQAIGSFEPCMLEVR